jgi:hypothetical protein
MHEKEESAQSESSKMIRPPHEPYYQYSQNKELAIKAVEFALELMKRATWYDYEVFPMYDALGKAIPADAMQMNVGEDDEHTQPGN